MGEGLLIAWLLSSEHLDASALDAAANRVRGGEAIRPSKRMLERARRALGSHVSSDPGLGAGQLVGLLLTNLVVSPLVGWVLWWWWRQTRPRAALQALALALPASVLFTTLLVWVYAGV